MFLEDKAARSMISVGLRTKKRTIEDLLFDLDVTSSHTNFIEKTVASINNDVKKGSLSKKQLNSLPLKIKKTETKFFKEFTQLQNKLIAKEDEHLTKFALPTLQKNIAKYSDEQFEQKIRQAVQLLKEDNPNFPPSQLKPIIEYIRHIRKEAKS